MWSGVRGSLSRRIVIAASTAGAISFAVLGWSGYAIPIYRGYQITDRLHFYVYFAEGLARFYWLEGSEDIYVDTPDVYRRMEVCPSGERAPCRTYFHASPGIVQPYALVSSKWPPPRGVAGPTVHLFGARTWIWLPIVLLTSYPATAIVRDRLWRRTRRLRAVRGLCLECGYDLTGLPEPICPECGTTAPLEAAVANICHPRAGGRSPKAPTADFLR